MRGPEKGDLISLYSHIKQRVKHRSHYNLEESVLIA